MSGAAPEDVEREVLRACFRGTSGSVREERPEPGAPPGSVIAPLAAPTPNVVTRGVRGAPALTDERALSGQQHFGRASSARNGF